MEVTFSTKRFLRRKKKDSEVLSVAHLYKYVRDRQIMKEKPPEHKLVKEDTRSYPDGLRHFNLKRLNKTNLCRFTVVTLQITTFQCVAFSMSF